MEKLKADQLLEKYNAGLTDKEESAWVETFYLNYQGSESVLPEKQLLDDKHKSIKNLLSEIREVKTRNIWPAIGIAATITVLCLLSFFYYLQKQNELLKAPVYAQNDIDAGGMKATLLLSNGTTIDLNAARSGELAKQDGVNITKAKDGTIVYTIADQPSHSTEVDFNTIATPNGGQYQVRLPDGTDVYLNAASSIKYPTHFSGKERKVEITGEIYFEVAHDKTKPFKVVAMGQTVEVLGTHFNISAYSTESAIKTTLIEGAVKITDKGRSRILRPGQQAQVSPKAIDVRDDINTDDIIAWKNGYFAFNEDLGSIMEKIGRWYNVEIVYKDNVDLNQEFGGRISRAKKLSSALKIMELTGNIHFKIEGRRVIVMK